MSKASRQAQKKNWEALAKLAGHTVGACRPCFSSTNLPFVISVLQISEEGNKTCQNCCFSPHKIKINVFPHTDALASPIGSSASITPPCLLCSSNFFPTSVWSLFTGYFYCLVMPQGAWWEKQKSACPDSLPFFLF